MGLTNIPLCRNCGAEEETPAYNLCECKTLASLRHTYLGSFSWTLRMLKSVQVWRLSGTSVEEQGSHNLVSDYGAHMAYLKI